GEEWLRRVTSILEHFPERLGTDQQREISLQGYLDDYIQEENKRVQRQITVFLPHSQQTSILPFRGIVEEYCRLLGDEESRDLKTRMAWKKYPQSMAAVQQLVTSTGLVASHDEAFSLDAVSAVL
ncbi:MAG: hypothetical protein HQM12_14440, partial [SAR324 cluster bacterium]|nr:hypothetical protein [SAR324 cluster bacterium]